jgi:soluble lytic murein transglycosylase
MSERTRTIFRASVLVVVCALAVIAFLYLRGPSFWQRYYYPVHWEREISEAASRHRVNPYLVAAVIDTESGWDADVRSGAGAVGLMQVLPSTAEELARRGIVDRVAYPPEKLSDPGVNIEYGTAYLRYLVERYHEIEIALAAYNAGLRNADQWAKRGGDIRETIEFPETRYFVLKVARARDRYRALYPGVFDETGR